MNTSLEQALVALGWQRSKNKQFVDVTLTLPGMNELRLELSMRPNDHVRVAGDPSHVVKRETRNEK